MYIFQHAERYWPKIEMDSIPHNNLQTMNPTFCWAINADPCRTIMVETGYQTRRENNGAESNWELRDREKSFVFGVTRIGTRHG